MEAVTVVATWTGWIVWLVIAALLLSVLWHVCRCAWWAVCLHWWQFRCAFRLQTVRELRWRKLHRSLFARFVLFVRDDLDGWSVTNKETGATWRSPTSYTLPPFKWEDA